MTGSVHYMSQRQDWETPQFLFDGLNAEFGFDRDVCATPENSKCREFFAPEDDALVQRWEGVCWMNPPYGQPVVSHFCSKLVDEFHNGDVTEAISLTNNATDTQWFRTLAGSASARCDIAGRVRFIGADGNPGQSPLQGQCLLYFGDRTAEFIAVFASLGDCWKPAREPPDEAD